MNKKKLKSALNLALAVLGVVLFLFLIKRIGLGNILKNIGDVGLWFIVVFLVGMGWLFCQSVAWSIIQAAFKPVPFLALFRARIIADGLNTLLPTANMGGDAARAVLVQDLIPLRQGVPGVIVDKTIEFIASLFYMCASLLISAIFLKIPPSLRATSIAVLGSITAGIFLFVVLQFKGMSGLIGKAASLIPGGRRWMEAKSAMFAELDGNIRFLYGRSKIRMIAAWILHLIGRLLGAVEVWVVLRAMGRHPSIPQVLFISVIVVIMNTALFIMPGQWGVSEGAHVLAGAALGYSASASLSLGIVRRLRKVLVAGIAVLLLLIKKQHLNILGVKNVD